MVDGNYSLSSEWYLSPVNEDLSLHKNANPRTQKTQALKPNKPTKPSNRIDI